MGAALVLDLKRAKTVEIAGDFEDVSGLNVKFWENGLAFSLWTRIWSKGSLFKSTTWQLDTELEVSNMVWAIDD